MANEIQPLRLKDLVQEASLVPELFDLARQWRSLARRQANETGHPVLLLPGFGASDWALEPLRRYLISQGYRTYRWGLGTNTGRVRELFPGVADRIRQLVEKRGEPLHVVGWSFGGYLAREVARDHPEWFRQVITLGSPIVGGAKHTIFKALYERRGMDLDAAAAKIEARFAVPLRVPVTAIYTKADGIVCWQACLDEQSPNVRHVEVKGSHCGLVYKPETLRLVEQMIRTFDRADSSQP